MQYPPNVRIIRVPCSGKVEITYILKAFEIGIDGIFVAGCLKQQCHFVEGNVHAEKRIQFAKEILEAIGIGGNRLEIFFLSSAMAPRFLEIVNEMTERIKRLGPALPKRVQTTKKEENITKREYLYKIIKNLALKVPKKPIPVPKGLEEFGRIEFYPAKCIGCKKCEEICPEEAVKFKMELDLPTILSSVKTGLNEKETKRVTKRQLLYETIAKIAIKNPSSSVNVPEGFKEYCTMLYNPKLCTVCEKCCDICPEEAVEVIREVDLQTIIKGK
jgi:coenzyme F420-reducing hydrogenase delta subunit/NAD-dependent dihydropyrimidine dehydrogenase PreA subunit